MTTLRQQLMEQTQHSSSHNPLDVYDIIENIFNNYKIFPLIFTAINHLWREVAKKQASIMIATKFGNTNII